MYIETFSRVEVGIEESVGVTAKRLKVHSSTLMFVDHVLCFFQKRRPFCCQYSFLPGVLFSLASASPTSWDFDDQLELSKRSMPQVDLFVVSLSSSRDQIRFNQLLGGKSPMTIICH